MRHPQLFRVAFRQRSVWYYPPAPYVVEGNVRQWKDWPTRQNPWLREKRSGETLLRTVTLTREESHKMDTSGANFSSKLQRRLPRRRMLLWFGVGSLLALAVIVCVSPLDLKCLALLIHSAPDVAIFLPEGCSFVRDVPEDPLVQYLEKEQRSQHLIRKEWITCAPLEPNHTRDFVMLRDSRWLPGYVGQTYQFRRTVVIFPYTRVSPDESRVVAEVCIVPWIRYTREIAGNCDGTFSVWK
jgi:hypothetical protein